MDPSPSWPIPDEVPGSLALRTALAAAYADPSRGYHDTQHLTEVLTRLVELSEAGAPFEQVPVVLAAWFHDAVYDGERDAEERSAAWAEEALSPLIAAESVAEVVRLVRLTETHTPDDADPNGSALSDADLAILAAPRLRYEEYVSAVRTEFAHLDDNVFSAGRAAVLKGLSDKPYLFHTAHAREHWEDAARANLHQELVGLMAE